MVVSGLASAGRAVALGPSAARLAAVVLGAAAAEASFAAAGGGAALGAGGGAGFGAGAEAAGLLATGFTVLPPPPSIKPSPSDLSQFFVQRIMKSAVAELGNYVQIVEKLLTEFKFCLNGG